MKIVRLVVGIISIVLFVFIVFQSWAVGTLNSMEGSGTSYATSIGFLMALCVLVAGIVGTATYNGGRGGAITAGCFYVVGGLIGGFIVWSVLSFVFAAVFIVGAVLQKPNEKVT